MLGYRRADPSPARSERDGSTVYEKSRALHFANRRFIPGGVVSVNRAVEPQIAFVKGLGSRIWDVDGNEYIDYHAAFAPHLLGHNDPDVTRAGAAGVERGAFPCSAPGRPGGKANWLNFFAEHVPGVEQVQFTTSGSEATYHAIRLARAYTGRDGIIVMQGGYNGWHNDVATNLMTPLDVLGPRVSPGEYPQDTDFRRHSRQSAGGCARRQL